MSSVNNNTISSPLEEDEEEKFDLQALYDPRAKYPPEQKLAAVSAFAVTGNLEKAAALTGVNYNSLKRWKHSAHWWPEALAAVRKQKQEELDGNLTRVIHSAMEQVVDRIENGDEVVLKDGSIIRKKMTGQQLATTLAILYDKRALLRGDPTSRQEKVSVDDRLDHLFDRFQKMAEDIQRTQDAKVVASYPANSSDEGGHDDA